MLHSNRRDFVRLLGTAAATGALSAKAGLLSAHESPINTAAEAPGKDLSYDTVAIVSRHTIVSTTPPSHLPKRTSTDALFLGNGDLLAAFAGDSYLPQFWITTNDFWELREWGGPRPFGRIIFEIPELNHATYHVEQDLATATLTATFTKGKKSVRMTSWVASAENLLVVEMESTGGVVPGTLAFRFPDELGLGVTKNDYWNYAHGGEPRVNHLPTQEKNWENGLLTAARIYHIRTDQQTCLSMAARFLGPAATRQNKNIFTLEPDKKLVFIASFQSWSKNSRPLDAVRGRVSQIDFPDIQRAQIEHRAWWSRYWNTSLVEINEPSIEKQYYRSHYNMAVFSRDPDFPPCDYGLCTSDDPQSAGDYKINYNYEAAFLGLNVAGHFEQTLPYDSPGLAHLPIACTDADKLLGHGGAYMSLGLGPKGTIAEHIWLGQKSQNAFYLVNTAERWYLTRDIEYARKVYPMVREVVQFWETDLRYEDGRYLVVDDSAHEQRDHHCINNCAGVAFVRMIFRLILDMSADLNLDKDLHDKWRHILEKMSPIPIKNAGSLRSIFKSPDISLQDVFPTGVLTGKPVIILEEEGYDWSFICSVQTIPIYPSGEIGLDSDPELLEAARNTVSLRSLSESYGKTWSGPKPIGINRGAWFDRNQGCLFFTAAVRIGYNPEIIWSNLLDWSDNRVWPNGFRKDINDGIENYSTIPNAIQEMMLLSHENVVRLFHVWPRKLAPNARFVNLWAYGAFRVSSKLTNGIVSYVQIESLKGKTCIIENPWPGYPMKLTRSGATEYHRGTRLTIKTSCGEKILITPQ